MNLDNLEQIKKLDSKNMLGSLELLGKQVEQVWNLAKKIKVPANYKSAKNLVILGMGGSTLGGHILKSVFFSELKVPVEIVNGYHVPAYVNKESLVLVISYSGTTEEALFSMKEAVAKKAKILVITSGGELVDWTANNTVPSLIFTTENNPCGSPRMGLGYMIFGQLILLAKAGLLKMGDKEVAVAIEAVASFDKKFGAYSVIKNNKAKQFADEALDRSVWYAAGEHLAGNAHAAANQMDENAKRFAGYYLVPEMNHHLLEGMLYPKTNQKDLIFILLNSKLYSERVQKRFEVTKKVLEKNKIKFVCYDCVGADKLAQACEALIFCSYISYYSAILQGIDPTAIPFVDFFKAQLKK